MKDERVLMNNFSTKVKNKQATYEKWRDFRD